MKHAEVLKVLEETFPCINGLNAAILYGSIAAVSNTPNSDIDIKLLIEPEFSLKEFKTVLSNLFNDSILTIMNVDLRNKIVIYFKSHLKVEFGICNNLNDIDRDMKGSLIKEGINVLLYSKNELRETINDYIEILINEKDTEPVNNLIINLADKFIYEFESCSSLHRRSDAYRFYYFYNIALHAAVQIYHLSKSVKDYNFLPRYFVAETISAGERSDFYTLNGCIYLPEANSKKRNLLDFFYHAIELTELKCELEKYKTICEFIYERDYFWNFRDASLHNSKIKPGKIFRTATLTVFQNDERVIGLLNKHSIKTIIDLRADRELEESSYNNEFAENFEIVRAPFDPWNQPEWFKENYHFGTNEEIAYRFFALACKNQIKKIFETLLTAENPVALHCFAGKDRTGIVISMIHMLSGAGYDEIKTDFLASEVDMKLNRLQVVLDEIEKCGGIEPYLLSCNLSASQLDEFKKRFFNGN